MKTWKKKNIKRTVARSPTTVLLRGPSETILMEVDEGVGPSVSPTPSAHTEGGKQFVISPKKLAEAGDMPPPSWFSNFMENLLSRLVLFSHKLLL